MSTLSSAIKDKDLHIKTIGNWKWRHLMTIMSGPALPPPGHGLLNPLRWDRFHSLWRPSIPCFSLLSLNSLKNNDELISVSASLSCLGALDGREQVIFSIIAPTPISRMDQLFLDLLRYCKPHLKLCHLSPLCIQWGKKELEAVCSSAAVEAKLVLSAITHLPLTRTFS